MFIFPGCMNSAISVIHSSDFSVAGVFVANSSVRGLNDILIFFFLYCESKTSLPSNEAVKAVILCWPSIIICFPSDDLPSFNLTEWFFQVIIYPTGYPLYKESIKSLTFVESQTNGLWISGIAIIPLVIWPKIEPTLTLLTSYWFIIILPIQVLLNKH